MSSSKLLLLLVSAVLTFSCTESSEPVNKKSGVESFEGFYKSFRSNKKFRIERTLFPVKVTIYTGYGDTDKNSSRTKHISMEDISSGKEVLYVKEEIVKSEGYSHFINKKGEAKVLVLVGPEESEAAVGYIFEKRKGRWYLVAHEDYWGS